MIDEMTRACLAIASRCSRSSLSRASSTSSSRMVRCACRAFCSCADSMHFTAMQAIRRWISSTPAKCATSKFVSASPPLTHSLSVCLTTPCFVVAPTAGNATTYAVTPFAGAILLHFHIFSTQSAHVFAACSLARLLACCRQSDDVCELHGLARCDALAVEHHQHYGHHPN